MLYFVAIGGATCSGKTTLAKLVKQVLPRSVILHQDDFAPPQELVPVHPVHNVQDWDDPEGAILWDKQRQTIKHIRQTGKLPEDHFSHDHMNAQKELSVSNELVKRWKEKFRSLEEQFRDDPPSFVIADGFLILYDDESVREFDVRFLVREDYDTLVARRKARDGYYTAAQSNPEGAHWHDPPGYWDNIVWPAYIKAHRSLFKDGDVEHGEPDADRISGLQILEPKRLGLDGMLDATLQAVYDVAKTGHRRQFDKP